MSNKGPGGKGLSGKEAALLAAARRELAKPPGANPAAQIVTPAAPQVAPAAMRSVAPLPPANKTLPEDAAPAEPLPVQDIDTRMAMLMDAERQASVDRRKRVRRTYLIMVSAVMVPAFIYTVINLIRLLAR